MIYQYFLQKSDKIEISKKYNELDGTKRFDNWVRLEMSINLMKYITDLRSEVCKITVRGNHYDTSYSGTYLHPKLITHLACWISPAFAWK